ncbi:ArsR family transcriptional regulator [Pedobacter sp. P351]|uniref:ArsR family transcriptional regulator n=1 Tax=Pedobacter superstes TaxID=3133441 RepID=UPI0030A6F453
MTFAFIKKGVYLRVVFLLDLVLNSIVTSKTRLKLLLKFFINSDTKSYLRSLAVEFNESTNAVRIELNRLSKAGLLHMHTQGNTVIYQANKMHPLFPDIVSIVKKYVGIDQIIGQVVAKLGDLKLAYISGDYAHGKDSGIIDMVLVGNINKLYVASLIDKAESVIKRKIRSVIFTELEYEQFAKLSSPQNILIIFNERPEC